MSLGASSIVKIKGEVAHPDQSLAIELLKEPAPSLLK